MVQGKINRGRHTDHSAGRHSIRTNQCPPPSSPHFVTGRMPFLPPNQQCQSTEGIRIREKMLEFSSTVLPAPSPYLVMKLTVHHNFIRHIGVCAHVRVCSICTPLHCAQIDGWLSCVLGNQLQGWRDEISEGCWWVVCTGYHGEAGWCQRLH